MLALGSYNSNIEHLLNNQGQDLSIECDDIEEKVKLLIFRDIFRLNWTWKNEGSNIVCYPPAQYDKETIRKAMAIKRQEIITINRDWINHHLDLGRSNLGTGEQVLRSRIQPVIEVCATRQQHTLFRIFRYYWSSPYSEYVGRRIKLIIRDAALPSKPVIGIAALGSPIIHIPERDDWIGWSVSARTKNINYTMDAYVIGALPPYNYLLGGKLVSYILASKEVRKIYENKYRDKITIISKQKRNKLVGFFTTGLYGHSAQYNRIRYSNQLLYKPIGFTKGFGTLHLTKETISAMQIYLDSKGVDVSNKFGAGPIWTMRVIHKAGALLNFDPDFLLKHSFKRSIYFVSYAKNSVEYLNGRTKAIEYFNYSMENLVNYWRERWLNKRRKNLSIINKVRSFDSSDFSI